MNGETRDRISARALASLKGEGPASPPPDLAARAAAYALAAPTPSPLHELVASVLSLSRPAAALGCAAALLLGVVHTASSSSPVTSTSSENPTSATTTNDSRRSAASTSLELLSADEAAAAVLPFSVEDRGGVQ